MKKNISSYFKSFSFFEKIGLAIIISSPILYGIVAYLIKPQMNYDSAWGLLVLRSMVRGGEFNFQVYPNFNNLAFDTARFITWWSPGQYTIPGMFTFFGITLGTALVLTSVLFSLLGVVGWFYLFRLIGFSRKDVFITCIAIVGNLFFYRHFIQYHGGELLLFGVAPWLISIVWTFRKLPLISIPIFLLAFLITVFMKLTGAVLIISLMGGMIATFFCFSREKILYKSTVLMGTGCLFAIIFYLCWVSHGSSPVHFNHIFSAPLDLQFSSIAFAFFEPIGAAFSLGQIISSSVNKIFLNSSSEISIPHVSTCLFPFSMGIYYLVWKGLKGPFSEYKYFLYGALSVYVVLFILIWILRMPVSFDERHFLPISLLFSIALVHVFRQHPVFIIRYLFFLILGISVIYGIKAFLFNERKNLSLTLGSQGFRHEFVSKRAIDFIRNEIDPIALKNKDTILFVHSPEVALESSNARIMDSIIKYESIESLQKMSYRGRISHLYVLLSDEDVLNGKGETILKSFKDYQYSEWKKIDLDGYKMFSQ
ncbi:MAG: hypothetical protein ACD_44C00049G0006 [uncultured bacterium]|nr:MAG: hypothetical protein ACD_44C00049G0006 [uncultured bacterium]